MSPPVGPTGLTYCRGDEGEVPVWRLGAAYGYTATHLVFDTGGDPALGSSTTVGMMKHAASIVGERRLGDRWSVQVSLGTAIAGELDVGSEAHQILPGPFATIGGSYRAVDEKGWVPFVLLSASLGASLNWTRQRNVAAPPTEAMTAFDGRLGLAVGKTIAGVVSPYVVARGFGLPVLWNIDGRSVVGTDANHYQLGLGAAVRIGNADIDVEGVPLGEQALVVGGGWAF